MANMDYPDYQSLIENNPVDTNVVEFHVPNKGRAAACLMDRVENGLSAVYSFFDPALDKRSLGSFVILVLIEKAQAAGLPYVYLGFWIEASRKMRYKSRFEPIQGFGPDGWRPLDEFMSAHKK